MIPVDHKDEREELTRAVAKPSSPLGRSRAPVSLARTTIVALVAAIVGGTVVALVIDRRPPTSPASARTQTDSSAVTGPASASWAPIAKRAARGVAEITVTRTITFAAREGRPTVSETESVFGTGFLIDRSGSIVTNEHVMEGGGTISVRLADGYVARGALVGADPSSDLAIVRIRVAAQHLHPLTLGKSETLRLGAPVLAIGTPFGYAGSASAGIISGFNRQIASPNGYPLADAIQTDAAVNHGNSGGPLLDANGKVVGVNAQLANSGVNGNVGVAFAIPVDAGARKVIEQLSTSGKALHAWLGIAGATLNAQLAAAIGLPRVRGVLVTGIAPASPAARSGLEAGSHFVRLGTRAYCAGGDVITAVGGATVTTSSGLQNALERFQPGSTIVVGIVHGDGTRAQRSLKLVAQPAKRSPITQDC